MPWSGYADDSVPKAQGILARAKQGDPQAINQLYVASRSGGWRPDNRNAAIDAWNELSPGTDQDLPRMKNPHGFLGDWDKAIGKGLKTVAPFAGLIPGVGPLLGAGLAAGGSALGGQMHGDKFSLLDTALAGGAGYLGGKANPFGSKGGIPAAPDISGMGDATYRPGGGGLPSGGFGPGEYAGGLPNGSGGYGVPDINPIGGGGGQSILDRVLGQGTGGAPGGGGWLDKLLQYGPMVAGGISNANRQHESDQMMQDAVKGSTAEWNARAPLRSFAQSNILSLPTLKRRDLSAVFADPGNMYG